MRFGDIGANAEGIYKVRWWRVAFPMRERAHHDGVKRNRIVWRWFQMVPGMDSRRGDLYM